MLHVDVISINAQRLLQNREKGQFTERAENIFMANRVQRIKDDSWHQIRIAGIVVTPLKGI